MVRIDAAVNECDNRWLRDGIRGRGGRDGVQCAPGTAGEGDQEKNCKCQAAKTRPPRGHDGLERQRVLYEPSCTPFPWQSVTRKAISRTFLADAMASRLVWLSVLV